jgi:threonine dehydrogenase-like Zn-dependent dehydrogenase
MLALRKLTPARGLDLVDAAEPRAAPGEVIVEVAAAGICGSDLHVDDWAPGYHFIAAAMPVTIGHEFAGRVAVCGPGVRALAVGQPVVVMPSVTCGACVHCRTGDIEHCVARTGIGMTRNGAFARRVAVPERNCIVVPDALDAGIAALTEPLTVAAEAVARGSVGPGARVLVLGPGTIGQGIALMARSAGAGEIVVCGRDDAARLATVRALGFARTFDLADSDAAGALDAVAGDGFDVVLEATGAPAAVPFGLARLRSGGVFVMTGIHAAPVAFDATMLVRRRLDIRGSYRAPLATWRTIIDALVATPEAFAPMVTHRLPLHAAREAFALAHRREGSKIVLDPTL